jgi:hypothetical protein
MSSDEVNHAPATEITSEIPVAVEVGRPKRKRVPRQLADALNGCLCGSVLDGSLSGVVKCRQAGCETQWVSTCLMGADLASDSQYTSSITYNVSDWSKSHETGCVWLARRPDKDAGESASGDDVIFPYLDMFLIM